LRKSLLILIAIFSFTACSDQQKFKAFQDSEAKPNFNTEVIYGEDNRKDWFEVLDENLKDAARATVGIVDKSVVQYKGDTVFLNTLSSNLCPNEKFADQERGPVCSGFLVGPDLVLTAGHCVGSERECKDYKFVFDYAKVRPGHDPSLIPKSKVYSCKTLIGQEFTRNDQDWALIRLDRPVTDRRPLEIERSTEASLNTPLTIIGHPSGLPSKIARGGKIHKVENHHYVADLDSFGGNSGSAVLNANSLKVEGILVRGRTDYKQVGGCLSVNICEEGIGTSCKYPSPNIEGEHISKTISLSHLIPLLNEEGEQPDTEDPVEAPRDPDRFVSKVTLPIPDSYLRSVTSKISNVSALEGSNTRVRIVVEHTYISDLRVILKAPNGNEIILHNKTGRRVQNINGTYGVDLTPFESLSNLGTQNAGDWTLRIQDSAPLDKGHLIEWEIIPEASTALAAT